MKNPKDLMVGNSYYQINGVKYHRVTKIKNIINNEGLNIYRAKSDYDESQKYMHIRGKLGKTVHALFQKILEGKNVDIKRYETEIKEDITMFKELVNNCHLQPEALEQVLYSMSLSAAGTADYIGSYKSYIPYLPLRGRGKNRKHMQPRFLNLSHVVGDWKTSPRIHPDFWIQLAAYLFMFEEQTGIKLDGGFIAQFRDNKMTVEEKTYDELAPYYTLFKHCIPLLEFRKNILPKGE